MLQTMQQKVDAFTQQNHDWQAHMECLHHDLKALYDRQRERTHKAIEEMAHMLRRQREELQYAIMKGNRRAFSTGREITLR